MIYNLMWVVIVSGCILFIFSIWLNWYIGQPSKRIRTKYKQGIMAKDYYTVNTSLNTNIINILLSRKVR